MNVTVMRRVDRFLGVPLCWCTGLLAHIPGFKRTERRTQTFLVIKFFGLGSILLSTPFLSLLRSTYPHARILYLSFAGNKEVLERLPQSSASFTISTQSPIAFCRDTLSVLGRLSREHIDVVFDLEFFSKFSTLISTLTRAPIRVGYDLPTLWRRKNLTHPVTLNHSDHVVDVFLHQLSALNIIPDKQAAIYSLSPSPAERESTNRKLNLQTSNSRVICVNMNAGAASLERRWPGNRFIEVLQKLANQYPVFRFVCIGNEQEREYVQQYLDTAPELQDRVTNCAGMLTLGELAALLEHSVLLLTNDTGPMHVAASLGTPMVALFGPESPGFYGPRGNMKIIYKSLACSPCLNIYNAKLFECPYDAKCMREISTTEVFTAVLDSIAVSRIGRAS